MTCVIALANPKGGVGKSTITINLGVAFYKEKKEVIMIDADPKQQSLRKWKEYSKDHDCPAVFVMDRPTLHVDIKKLRGKFDYVLIDSGSKADEMMLSVLRSADVVVIPVQPSGADIDGCEPLIDLIKELELIREKKIKAIFLINAAESKTRLAKTVERMLLKFNLPVLESRISRSVQHIQMYADGLSVFDNNNPQARKLSNEILAVKKELMEFINE